MCHVACETWPKRLKQLQSSESCETYWWEYIALHGFHAHIQLLKTFQSNYLYGIRKVKVPSYIICNRLVNSHREVLIKPSLLSLHQNHHQILNVRKLCTLMRKAHISRLKLESREVELQIMARPLSHPIRSNSVGRTITLLAYQDMEIHAQEGHDQETLAVKRIPKAVKVGCMLHLGEQRGGNAWRCFQTDLTLLENTENRWRT